MSPQEKAEELFVKYNEFNFETIVYSTQRTKAKECALIAVDEILKNGSLINQSELYKANKIKPTPIYKEYWKQVKKEIKNL